jgi:RNA polymerase sigma factor (TIGR02999 family)
MSDVTLLIEAAQRGDRQAAADLLPLVYDELRKLAAAKMASERPDHTLGATALVHEAFLRLVGPAGDETFAGRTHFFAVAAEAMRRILVDRARCRLALKRGGGGQRLNVDLEAIASYYSDDELIETDEVLNALDAEDPNAATLVRLHVFGGFSIEEAGLAVGMTRSTAYRNWEYARSWLRVALGKK